MDSLPLSDSSCTVGISPALLQAIAQTISTAASTGSSPAGSLVASAGKLGLTTPTTTRPLTRPIIAVKVRTVRMLRVTLSSEFDLFENTDICNLQVASLIFLI